MHVKLSTESTHVVDLKKESPVTRAFFLRPRINYIAYNERPNPKGTIMDEEMTLWNKKAEDLTVGDALKINLVVIAAMAVIPVTIYGVGYGIDGIKRWNTNRKIKKFEKQLETV